MENNLDKEFNNFIYNLEDIVQTFIEKLNNLGFTIDYTTKSVNILESYLLDKHIRLEDDDFYDASCFLGDLFKKNYGGEWEIDKNQNSPFYKKPVINNFIPSGVIFSPFTILKEALAKRKKGALMQILKTSLNEENKPEDSNQKKENSNYRNRSFLEESPNDSLIIENKEKREETREERIEQPYKIYRGKSFTEEEWLRFEEEEYNKFSSKNNLNTNNEKPSQGGGFFLDEKQSDW